MLAPRCVSDHFPLVCSGSKQRLVLNTTYVEWVFDCTVECLCILRLLAVVRNHNHDIHSMVILPRENYDCFELIIRFCNHDWSFVSWRYSQIIEIFITNFEPRLLHSLESDVSFQLSLSCLSIWCFTSRNPQDLALKWAYHEHFTLE
jgi:hypothetical protein